MVASRKVGPVVFLAVKNQVELHLNKEQAPIASNVSGQALKGVQTRANIFRGKIFRERFPMYLEGATDLDSTDQTFHPIDVFESKDPPKKELEKMIVENGGEFAQARTEGNLAIPIGNRLGRKSHPVQESWLYQAG